MTLGHNNPGNIRANSHDDWHGQIGIDDNGFCIFDTMTDGVRALCKLLLTYQDKHDLQCVEDIVQRWAPPGENDTDAYIDDVCARTHWRPDELIDLHVPQNLIAMASAMAHHETGQYLDSTVLAAGAASAVV